MVKNSSILNKVPRLNVKNIYVYTIYKYTVSISKIVLFQTLQFGISSQFRSFLSIDLTLSAATTSDQSGPRSDCNERVVLIAQSFSITGTSLSDCLVSYAGHLLGETYLSAEKQSVYLIAPDDLARIVKEN